MVVDGVAILIAVELIGLLVDVNDPEFVQKGGWLQPLPTMQEQISAIATVTTGWLLNISLWTIALTVTPAMTGMEGMKNSNANPWTSRFLPTILVFVMLRFLYAGVAIILTLSAGGGGDNEVDMFLFDRAAAALQDVWVVGLLLAAARYALGI